MVSGIEAYEIEDEKRPVLVGERTNVLGSRKFKRLIADGKFDEAAEVGRAQTRKGAAILDVCLQDPDRHELADVTAFLDILVKKVKAPIMIDSTDPVVVEEALKRLQGKAVINSINLEDGEEKFERVTPLVRRFGAAVVVGCIDDDPEQAQAVTRERKLAVARRSFDLLTTKYGIEPEDIYFDPLVFPCGTGDATYSGSGVETIEGIRLIKGAMPKTKTILGISNVSFGLPQSGREVLNSVFLHHCVEAGLDLAIVNAEALAPFSRIPDEDKKVCDDLLFWRGGRSDRRVRRALRGQATSRDGRRAQQDADRRAPRAQHHRGLARGPVFRPRREAAHAQAARDHQRAAHGRHGRGRQALQRQRNDRCRGPAVSGSDEGGGRLPRAAHGEVGDVYTRQDRARHGEG